MNEAEKVYLEWSKRIRSIAQNGLVGVTDEYNRERYEAFDNRGFFNSCFSSISSLSCPIVEQ